MRINKYGESEVKVRDYTFPYQFNKDIKSPIIYISNYKDINVRLVNGSLIQTRVRVKIFSRARKVSENGTEETGAKERDERKRASAKRAEREK